MDMTTALTIKAQVVGANQISGLTNGLKKVEGQTNKAAGAMGRLKTAAGGVVGAMRTLLPVLGVAAIGKFAKSNLDAADAMSKMSQRTGVAAPQLDKFRKVAELSDTSIEGLGKGFKTLASNMYDAQTKGTGPAADAFNKLGISVTDANGKLKASDQVMLEVADRFKLMKDGPEKAALAADLFGAKIGDELIPLLNSGGDAVRNMSTSLTQEFADGAAAFNDRLETMQEKFGDLGLKLTEALLPVLEKIVGVLETLVNGFMGLPGPIQNVIIALGGIAAAALVFAPIVSAITTLGPLITGLVAGIGGIVTALTGGGGALAAIAAVFSGPVGWVALVVAAGVAIYTFRDQIAEAFSFIGDIIRGAWELYKSVYIDPIVNAGQFIYNFFVENWGAISEFVKGVFTGIFDFYKTTLIDPVINLARGLIDTFTNIFRTIGDAIKAPFETAFNFIRGIIRSVLQAVANAMNGVVNSINSIIKAANAALSRLKLPTIPLLPKVSVPQFAEGGVVSGPTLAMVGEGGQPEYIVPASKAGAFAQNWMAGIRGPGAIPKFAEGGMVAPANANVNIQTGPVTQMNGTNFVTTSDLSRAVQSGIDQTLDLIRRDGNTRAALGLS